MLRDFDYFNPTELIFGCGRIKEIGKVATRFGKNCMLITSPIIPQTEKKIKETKDIIKDAGLNVIHFDNVVPNPTTDSITEAANVAKSQFVDLVIGMGGGSAIDTAKAIAVEATHEGTAWDYLYFKKDTQPTIRTLPIIAIPTTSGTGSQVTRISVLSNKAIKKKSALFSIYIYPKVSIVDPEIMISMPEKLTSVTGFDAFCHAFEAYINVNATPYSELLSLESIKIIHKYLPTAIKMPLNIEARTYMAYADTLAGLSFSSVGTAAPHGFSMAISGNFPNVMHGEGLAVIYPEFMEFTYKSSISKFATLARIFNEKVSKENDAIAAKESINILIDFLKKINLFIDLKSLNIPESSINDLADKALELPDFDNNPAVIKKKDVINILNRAYKR